MQSSQTVDDLTDPSTIPSEEHSASEESENELAATDVLSADAPRKKKKKKKSKVTAMTSGLPDSSELPPAVMQELDAATNETAQKALKQLQMMDLLNGKSGIGGFNQKDLGEHKFWTTQPVPQWGDAAPIGDGYIEPPKPRDQVRQDPYPLPKDFEWSFIDVGDPKQSKEVYDLLSANYVEDDDAAFRFNYSSDFLQWALRPPGYHKEWHIGVRVSSNKKLVAFISGVPMTLRVLKNTFMATEINYLCVHKKLRSKRLAPVLIKEITRQVHLKGIFQAIYTAGILIPTPISICRYFHRALNIPKLIDTKFTHVPRSMTLARMIRINKLPSTTTSTSGLREMEERDVQQVTRLFSKYMERFSMSPIFSTQEIRHQFLSGKGRGNIGDGGAGRREGQVTWAYVVEDPQSKRITDFFSFYSLPSTVINNTKHPLLEAAYLYYYASETAFTPGAEEDETLHKRLTSLLGDALVVAKEANFDVFNALTLMDNVELLRDLKFVEGDGYLNFYLYNWRTSPLSGMVAVGDVPSGKGIGVVML